MTTTVQVRELSVPVRSAAHVMLFPGARADGTPTLYATLGQNGAPFFVLDIDLHTGHCTKALADVRFASEAVSALWSDRWQCLYAGSCYAGHLHRYDPRDGRLADLGPINAEQPEAALFPCSMDEHPDGTLYIGSYNGCDLTRYDPATGVFTRYGRIDETDMYLYVQCGVDGTVAALVMNTHPHVIVFDPATRERRTVGPVADAQAGIPGARLVKGADGLLYITSHEGACRLSGLESIPVADVPAEMPAKTLSDGSTYRWLDAHVFEHRQLEITAPDGTTRMLHLDWEGDGTGLFICHLGPDGLVYGSSMLPLRLFRYDPATGVSTDLGACSTVGGEAYSMANLDGKLYIGCYPKAMLSIYDPAKPYRFGTDAEANPREVGRPDNVACRPRAMLAGPAGKVWIASQPDYGLWGGTLASFDPVTETFVSHRHLIQDCSCDALTWLEAEGLLLVGLNVEGSAGTQPIVSRAGLVLWNPIADAPVWQGDFGLDIYSVADVLAVGDGLVYALITLNGDNALPGLYLLDLRAKTFRASSPLPNPPFGKILPGWCTQTLFLHRGYVYGATDRGVFRAPLGTTDVELYCPMPEHEVPDGTGVVLNDEWIFPSLHRLRAMALPTKG